MTIAFPSYPTEGRPTVKFTADCPCGAPDVTWYAVLVPLTHALTKMPVSVVVHQIVCAACDPVEGVAA